MPSKLLRESCLEILDHLLRHCKYQFLELSLFVYLIKGENNHIVTTQLHVVLFLYVCSRLYNVLSFDFIFVCCRDLSNNQIQSLHEDALKGVSIETM